MTNAVTRLVMVSTHGLLLIGISPEMPKPSPAPTAAAIMEQKYLQTTAFLRGR
jgi:hypothetical protein